MDHLFKSFSIAYYFSIFFGTMPYNIPEDKAVLPTVRKQSKWNVLGIFFGFIYGILVLISILQAKQLTSVTKFKGNRLISIHDKTQSIVAPMFVWSYAAAQIFIVESLLTIPLHLRKLRTIFDDLRNIFNGEGRILLLGESGNGAISERMAENVRRNTVKIIVVYTLLAIFSAISSFSRIRLSFVLNFYIMADVIVKKLVLLSESLQFCALCDMLLHSFERVNKNLKALSFCRRENKIRDGVFPYLAEMLPPTNVVINRMNEAHSQLCDVLFEVNRTYRVHNLLTIVTCTLQLLPHLFLTGICLTYSNYKMLHWSFFMWPAQYLFRVYIICEAASITTREILLFTERIRSRPIQFSLCGICKLSNELFVSNLLVVGGYFMIILQSYMTEIENWPIEIDANFESNAKE